MKLCSSSLAALAVAGLWTGAAFASNPGTDSRADNTATSSGSTTVCEGGTNPTNPCTSSGDCTGGGTCTGVANVRVAARGLLTIITDTKPPNTGWAATANAGGCTNPSEGNLSSCETRANALLTLMLEFTLNGKKYLFAESFKCLPGGEACDGSTDDFTIDSWNAGGGLFQAGWNQPAVESTLAERSVFSGNIIQIRWAGLPPGAENAVGAVLGRTPTQRVALSRTDEVPVCTDPTPCNHGPTNTRFSDHSSGTDVLGTVRRYKVDIAVVGP